jgi:hypothetical protein
MVTISPKYEPLISNYPRHFRPLFTFGERKGRVVGFHTKARNRRDFSYRSLGIGEEDIPKLTELVFDPALNTLSMNKRTKALIMAPIHALYALTELKAGEPFSRLLEEGLERFGEEDFYFIKALMEYIRELGPDHLEILFAYARDRRHASTHRLFAVDMLVILALDGRLEHPEDVEAMLVAFLQDEEERDGTFTTGVIESLVEISGDKHLELIRQVFETKPVDPYVIGELENRGIVLGFREERNVPLFPDFPGESDAWSASPHIAPPKVGRNDPCPCGSGKKYKKCCMQKEER